LIFTVRFTWWWCQYRLL